MRKTALLSFLLLLSTAVHAQNHNSDSSDGQRHEVLLIGEVQLMPHQVICVSRFLLTSHPESKVGPVLTLRYGGELAGNKTSPSAFMAPLSEFSVKLVDGAKWVTIEVAGDKSAHATLYMSRASYQEASACMPPLTPPTTP